MHPPQQQTAATLPGAVALTTFCGQGDSKQEFTDELRLILEVTAWTGKYWHDWSLLKPLLSFRLKQILREYHESDIASGVVRPLATGETFDELVKRLDEGLDCFVDGPPFTLQRLCEVLLNPQSTYPIVDKVALALEKLLLVTSTLPISKDTYPSFPGLRDVGNEKTAQHQEQNFEAAEANGFSQDVTLADQQTTVAASTVDDLQTEASKVKGKSGSEDEQSAGKVLIYSEAILMEEDLGDIALGDDQNTATDT